MQDIPAKVCVIGQERKMRVSVDASFCPEWLERERGYIY